jgi:hypothetical protein
MTDREITIRLPEDLIRRAEAAGIDLEASEPEYAELIEQRIRRKEAAQRFLDIAHAMAGSMTPEEIEAELALARAERIARDQATGT